MSAPAKQAAVALDRVRPGNGDAKPRIAVLSSYFPTREEPYRGHSAFQTLRWMKDRAELRAFVPLPVYPSWYTRTPSEFRYKRMDLSHRLDEMEARYFQFVTLPGAGRPLNGRLALRQVERAVTEFAPDLILNYWLYPDGWAAVKLGKRLGVPVIVCGLGSDLRRVDDFFTRRATSYTVSHADYVLSVSHELQRQAIAFGAPRERTRTILNGYDETIFRPGDRRAERERLGLAAGCEYILSVGSLIPTKGLRELWTAFAGLAARRPALRLVCAGEGPLGEELKRLAGGADLSDRLILPGKLSSAQVRDWMVAADLFCLPSYSEGCPNVVIEALACDRAVVASDVGGIPELVNHANGVLMEPRNAAALQSALETALSRTWPEGAVAATYRRSWRQVADETWEVCEGLL